MRRAPIARRFGGQVRADARQPRRARSRPPRLLAIVVLIAELVLLPERVQAREWILPLPDREHPHPGEDAEDEHHGAGDASPTAHPRSIPSGKESESAQIGCVYPSSMATAEAKTDACRPLLAGLIDHAPLFPPASLPLAEALEDHRRALSSPHAWLVARFVCPA